MPSWCLHLQEPRHSLLAQHLSLCRLRLSRPASLLKPRRRQPRSSGKERLLVSLRKPHYSEHSLKLVVQPQLHPCSIRLKVGPPRPRTSSHQEQHSQRLLLAVRLASQRLPSQCQHRRLPLRNSHPRRRHLCSEHLQLHPRLEVFSVLARVCLEDKPRHPLKVEVCSELRPRHQPLAAAYSEAYQ